METSDEDVFEYFEKLIEDGISFEQAIHLDDLVSSSPEIRRAYLEYTHQSTCLQADDSPEWDDICFD